MFDLQMSNLQKHNLLEFWWVWNIKCIIALNDYKTQILH